MGLLVYVDDILLTSNNAQASEEFKAYLDIEVALGPKQMFLCQANMYWKL